MNYRNKAKNKKVFATVFTNIENRHIVKDPGMIPYIMQENYGFYSVVPISSCNKYQYIKEFYSQIDTPIINDSKNKKIKFFKRLLWIKKNSSNIDILNLYFFGIQTSLEILVYKLINKQGLVYVHTDTDGKYLLKYIKKRKSIKVMLSLLCLKLINVNDIFWGIQNPKYLNLIKKRWPFVYIDYIPDGFY